MLKSGNVEVKYLGITVVSPRKGSVRRKSVQTLTRASEPAVKQQNPPPTFATGKGRKRCKPVRPNAKTCRCALKQEGHCRLERRKVTPWRTPVWSVPLHGIAIALCYVKSTHVRVNERFRVRNDERDSCFPSVFGRKMLRQPLT